MQYNQEELNQLHDALYKILGELVRVCDVLKIPYFIQGGSGIGAFFFEGIIPWDDDIDVGMLRKDYERFLKEAPSVLNDEFFLQWMETDPKCPFYFSKLRLNNTLYVTEEGHNIDMHQGISVDVFPFDKVPDNHFLQSMQFKLTNFLQCCFMGKDMWLWKRFGKPMVKEPDDGFVKPLLVKIVDVCCSKRCIYRMLAKAQSMFNSWNTTFYNMVVMPKDHIEVESIDNAQTLKFGPLMVRAPRDLEKYLRRHYGNIKKYPPKEKQVNHRPLYLSFDAKNDDGAQEYVYYKSNRRT